MQNWQSLARLDLAKHLKITRELLKKLHTWNLLGFPINEDCRPMRNLTTKTPFLFSLVVHVVHIAAILY